MIRFDDTGGRIAGKAPAGRVLIDSTGSGEVVDEVLRDRRHLSEDGLVVPVVAINKQTGEIEGDPDVISRGLAMKVAVLRAPNVHAELPASELELHKESKPAESAVPLGAASSENVELPF